MPMPVVYAFGAAVSSTGAIITPAIPIGTTTNDIVLLIHEMDPVLSTAALGAVTGYADVDTSSPVSNTGASQPTRLTVRWHRATGAESGTISVPAVTNHHIAATIGIRGCVSSGNPWNVISTNVDAATTATITWPIATTTAADCLVFSLIANGLDIGTAQFSAWTNASLAAPAFGEILDAFTLSGTGGGIGGAYGGKATAGAVAASTATGPASIRATMTIAMQGAAMLPQRPFRVPQAVQRAAYW